MDVWTSFEFLLRIHFVLLRVCFTKNSEQVEGMEALLFLFRLDIIDSQCKEGNCNQVVNLCDYSECHNGYGSPHSAIPSVLRMFLLDTCESPSAFNRQDT